MPRTTKIRPTRPQRRHRLAWSGSHLCHMREVGLTGIVPNCLAFRKWNQRPGLWPLLGVRYLFVNWSRIRSICALSPWFGGIYAFGARLAFQYSARLLLAQALKNSDVIMVIRVSVVFILFSFVVGASSWIWKSCKAVFQRRSFS